MVKRMAFIVTCIIFLGFRDDKPPTPVTLPAAHSFPTNPDYWVFRFSPGVPAQPSQASDGWYFDFPVYAHTPTTDCKADPNCASVHYLVTTVNARLTSSTLTLRFHIETTGGAQFQPLLSPDNVCNSPATVRPYIQRIGDDMTLGKGPDYRFWGPPITLADGGVDVTVPLTPDQWINVNGQNSPAGFAEALANVWRIGVTYGGGCFAGHGVNISGGVAKFTMTAFNLN